MKSVHDIIGPRFTRPTLRNVWHNIPLTLSAIALMSLAKVMSTPMEVIVLLILPALVASSFVRDAYNVLHCKITFYSLPISLLVSSVLLYLFIQTHFDTVEAQLQTFCGDAYTAVSWILCGMLYLLSAFFCTFLINWMLTYSDDGQRELFARVLHGKVMNVIIICCLVITVILFVLFSFDPYFWHDESFTLRLVSLSYANGIDVTAHDVHPPLYYLMLKTWLSVFSFGTHNVTVMVVLSRLFSFLAYVLTAILCWKKLAGSGISSWRRLLLLCFGASFALVWYGTEIRMYSWGLFFVTATYLFSRDVILGHGSWRTWLIITFFSLCAAYTHNFALISVSVIWLTLLVWLIVRDKRMIAKWIVCAVIIVVMFVPWLIVLLQQTRQVSADYWITLNKDDILRFSIFLLFPIHAIFPFLFVKALRMKDNRKFSFDDVMGMIVPLGTLFIGIVLSLLIRPIFTDRYLLPTALCMWISLFFIFLHTREKERFLLVCMLLFAFFISGYKNVCKLASDYNQMQTTRQLLDKIDKNIPLVYASDDGLEPTVLSCLTSNDIITSWHVSKLGNKRAKMMFPNIIDFGSENEMWNYLNRFGREFYYIIRIGTKEKARIPSGCTSVYIGDCRIEEPCRIYEIFTHDEQ